MVRLNNNAYIPRIRDNKDLKRIAVSYMQITTIVLNPVRLGVVAVVQRFQLRWVYDGHVTVVSDDFRPISPCLPRAFIGKILLCPIHVEYFTRWAINRSLLTSALGSCTLCVVVVVVVTVIIVVVTFPFFLPFFRLQVFFRASFSPSRSTRTYPFDLTAQHTRPRGSVAQSLFLTTTVENRRTANEKPMSAQRIPYCLGSFPFPQKYK